MVTGKAVEQSALDLEHPLSSDRFTPTLTAIAHIALTGLAFT
ncbi:MAG: hypothetical protein SFY66_04135 [Oculatellaceae cyanobacterium bins.114]|nr:hypothetical protein [Oculatellaceae cyanobacterium bins.114]